MKRIATAFMATLVAAGSLISAPAMAAPGDQSNRGERAAYRDNDQRDVNRRDDGGRSDDRGERRRGDDNGRWGANENDGRGNDNRNDSRGYDRGDNRDWRHNDRYDRYSDRNWRRGERLSAYDRRDFRPVSYRDHSHYRDAPRGYRYERNDRGDVLLIGIATGIIAGVILSGN